MNNGTSRGTVRRSAPWRARARAAVVACLVCGAGPLGAQTLAWSARHDGGAAFDGAATPGRHALAVDGAGNVHVAGRVYNGPVGSGADTDMLTLKYGPTGTLLWSALENSGPNSYDEADALALDGAGNVYVAGRSNAALVVAKYALSGQRLWLTSRTPPGSLWAEVAQIAVDAAGNVFVGGSFATRVFEGFEGYDYVVAKYDAAGVEQWQRTFASPGPAEGDDDKISGLGLDGAGRVIVTGSSRGHFLTRQYDGAGALLWSVASNDPGYATAAALAVDAAGNAYVTGTWLGTGNTTVYGTIKYDGNGVQQWLAVEPAHGGFDAAQDVQVDALGNVYVTGYVGPSGATDQATVKYAPNGARQWAVTFDGAAHGEDRADALAVDGAGNVYVTGYSATGALPNTRDLTTLKYDAGGVLQWQASWNGGLSDWGYGVVLDAPGNVYVTGSAAGSGYASDMRTLKYDASGAEQWSAKEPPVGSGAVDRPASGSTSNGQRALAVDAPGNVYVAGDTSFDASTAFLTVKYDMLGALQWARVYDHSPSGSDGAVGLAVDADGNVFVAGVAWNGVNHDACLLKYDALGNLQWVRTRDGGLGVEDYVVGLGLDSAGNVYVGGHASSQPVTPPTLFAHKYDGAGNLMWAVTPDEPARSNYAADFVVDAAGNGYLGASSTGNGVTRFLVVKLDTNGVRQWSALEPEGDYSHLHALAVDAAGNVYIAGESYAGTYDFVTVKYASDGLRLWSRRYAGGGNGVDRAYDLGVDSSGNIYVTGESYSSSGSVDFATLAYTPDGTLRWMAFEDNGGRADRAYAVALDTSGNVYVTGESGSLSSRDYHSVSYSPAGARRWGVSFGGAAQGADVPVALAVDGVNSVYVTGWSEGARQDFLTLKYEQPEDTDLAVSLTDAPDPVVAGGQVTYTLTVTNAGPFTVPGVRLVDTLPAGLTFVSSTPGEPACVHADGVVTCQLDTLANLSSRQITIVAQAAPRTYGLVLDQAEVNAAPVRPDPVPTNNLSQVGTRVGWIKGDQNDDLKTDLYLQDETTGRIVVWTMDGETRLAEHALGTVPSSPTWRVSAVDDFDGDRRNDLLLWDTASGAIEVWLMDGALRRAVAAISGAPATVPLNWHPSASADFDHDGQVDLLWRNFTSQKIVIWLLHGTTRVGTLIPTPAQAVDPNWEIVAAADYDGDGHTDLLWYNSTSGRIVQWLMDANGVRVGSRFTDPLGAGNNNWKVLASGDYGAGPDGAVGTQDVVWRNSTSGKYVVWFLDHSGHRTAGVFTVPAAPAIEPLAWTVVGPR